MRSLVALLVALAATVAWNADALAMGGGCGNGTCSGAENCATCPADCACTGGRVCSAGVCTWCGNGACAAAFGETCSTCPADCGACCPNGACAGGETCSTCPADCGSCCGNGTCSGTETCGTCPADCGACAACPDGICQASENCGSCAADCGACPLCPNGFCDTASGENCTTCVADCGACAAGCGDATCTTTGPPADRENCLNCPADCGTCPACPDGACNGTEDCASCAADCGVCPPVACSPYAACSGYTPIGGYATTCGNGIDPQVAGGSGGAGSIVPGLPDLVVVAPNAMIMLGSDADFEFIAGTTTLPTCTPGDPTGTNELSAWWLLMQALTGTITDFSCGYDDRTSPGARIDNPDSPLHVVAWMTSQAGDGLLDAYNGLLKFGLMTYDNHPDKAGTAAGMWSYDNAVTGAWGQINLGCRDKGAERGALISVGLETKDDMAVINDMVQSEALCTIPTSPADTVVPFAERPIGAMLADFGNYALVSPDIAPPPSMGVMTGFDPWHDCRDKVAILIADGPPDGAAPANGYDDAVTAAGNVLSGASAIKTYVVGVGIPNPELDAVAVAGGTGGAFYASDLPTLRAVLNTVFGAMSNGVTTRTVPAVTSGIASSAAEQFEFSGAIEVGSGPWMGRLERTRFCCDDDGSGCDGTPGLVLAEEYTPADGDDYRARLDAQSTRTIFTFSPDVAATRTTFNTSIAETWVAAVSPTERDDIVNYVLGVSGRPTKLGDVFNSGPVVSTSPNLDLPLESYRLFKDFFATTGNERPGVVYVGTNDGIFHAFDIDPPLLTDPVEMWGIVPPYVLSTLKAGLTAHAFTVDGNTVVEDVLLVRDSSSTMPIPPLSDPRATGWYTIAVVPLGNGGRAVYGFDVTTPQDPNSVAMRFEFADTLPDGDADNVRDACDTSVTNRRCDPDLGFVLSRPVIGRVVADPGSGVKELGVAIFGGGYAGSLLPATVGRSAYVVSLSDGSLVKKFDQSTRCSGETADFDSPIVGDVAAHNAFTGAFTTRFFAGDMNGRLWRFDTSALDPDAWCQTAFTPAAYRNGWVIFDAPSLALDPDDNLVVIYGTGDTANLLSTDVGNVVLSLTEQITRDPATGDVTAVNAHVNWVKTLEDGEKMTGVPIVFDGCTYFATFIPSADATNLCSVGHGRLWGLDYRGDDPSAAVVTDLVACLDGDSDPTTYDPIVSLDLPDGSFSSGVSLVRRPACFATDDIDDPASSNPADRITRVTNFVPGTYTITAHIGAVTAGGNAPGTIPKIERAVTPPKTGGWATSWGEIFD